MFEKLIANQFGKYLQKYVQNLDEKTLRLGIFDGKLEIKDLQLKREALFELDLPIEVKKGCIGKLIDYIRYYLLYLLN